MVRSCLIVGALLLWLAASLQAIAESAHIGRFDDAGVAPKMHEAFRHHSLLNAEALLVPLHRAVAEGTLTGFDLRTRNVYQNQPAGMGFIYSHSSLQHMQELIELLNQHAITGDFYLTPKVSAFVFREGWGEPSDRVQTLENGVQLVNGRELASMFLFDEKSSLKAFRELIDRYAKKDSEDETGLITDAWWQPFYYIDQPFDDFLQINLVMLAAGDYEATLTVLPGRTTAVVDAMSQPGIEVWVDKVWVNPAFYRYLKGDFK